jgi:hypothetical protein
MMPEYLAAIAVSTGRGKDIERVAAFIRQNKLSRRELESLITRFHLDAKWEKIKKHL